MSKLDDCVRRMDAVLRRDSLQGVKLDPNYPIQLTIELRKEEGVGHLVEFFRYIKNAANVGHSFLIAADESADGPGKMFGKQKAGATCFLDGDGADGIGRIFLNGEDVTKVDKS